MLTVQIHPSDWTLAADLLFLNEKLYRYTLAQAFLERLPFRTGTGSHSRGVRQVFFSGFAATIGNPKMAAFFFGLFAPVADQVGSIDTRLVVVLGIVLADLAYHQALVQFTALAARSAPAKYLQRWLDAVAGALMTAFGIGLLSKAMFSRA